MTGKYMKSGEKATKKTSLQEVNTNNNPTTKKSFTIKKGQTAPPTTKKNYKYKKK